ncbi:hypothetical protein KVQ01_11035 [Escherichia coli]|uniref:hypothetical protein n=1 Tax=Escherichia coli TaxID=562 RepID=UPI000E04E1CD|nr:hypothetical protein [Escherichia coli]EFL6450602.1 hypothetical protein [Escherichia coli]MCH0685553.1 hypothetical protein [Escherichia coli]MDZ8667054.1 hypothetical protein [Escherichia coli]WRX87636.1 hypothetical protein SM938_22170 [Escherichia coli]STK94380.1 Uncharacterised protein [Escherichia coli]
MTDYYAKLDDDGKIIYMAQGPQEDETMVLVDFSSDMYYEFYYRMPIAIRITLPDYTGTLPPP